MSVLATIEPADLQVDAGAEATLIVRVRNRGTIVDQYDISVVGPTAPWAFVDPPSLRLFPDKEGEARVTFRPPRAPEPAADTYPFGVAVRAAADASSMTVEEGRVVVSPFVQLTSEIVPQTSRGSMSGSHDLTVQNIGNAVAEVSVKASDPDRLLNFEVAPERVGLAPGGSATVRARVKPKETFLLGSNKRLPFAVQVDEPTAGSFQVPATMEQRPIIPNWIKPVSALVITTLAAVLILPRMLGIELGTPSASPVAVATPSPTPTAVPITDPPITDPPITDPPITAAPTPTAGPGDPDTLTIPSQANLNNAYVLLKCAPKNACRQVVENRIRTILGNLQGTPTGARYDTFGTYPTGTLPITATWKAPRQHPYFCCGIPNTPAGNLRRLTIDLAPTLVGAPAYVLLEDIDFGLRYYTISVDDARFLRETLFVITPDPFAPLPDPGFVQYSYGWAYQQFWADCFLETCKLVKP